MSLILPMGRLRLRDIKELAQYLTVSKQQSFIQQDQLPSVRGPVHSENVVPC